MAEAEKNREEWQGGIFYETKEAFADEVTRFLNTRRKNRGATEWQIHHVATARPFVEVMQTVRNGGQPEKFRSKREEIRFFASLRRETVFPVVKKLLNEGYTVAEVSDALTLPYSTVYYYAKKIQNHKRLRDDRTLWHIDEQTRCIAPIKLPRDKEAALVRKEIMRKAQDKRERRMAKRLLLQSKGSSNG